MGWFSKPELKPAEKAVADHLDSKGDHVAAEVVRNRQDARGRIRDRIIKADDEVNNGKGTHWTR